jgi:signal peptidase I
MGNLLESRLMKNIEPAAEDGILLSAPVIMELIEAVHEKGASFRFQARGFSMTPAIRDGDVITVAPLKGVPPRRGDVLAFRHPKRPQLLVHRVLRARSRGLFIRGDSCPEADGWVPLENVIGVVTGVERGGFSRSWPFSSRRSPWTRLHLCCYLLWLPFRRRLAGVRRVFSRHR